MEIEKLILQNFRNIGAERTFLFNNRFTVIIGVNGKGKSTILHGLRVACGSFFLGFPRHEVRARHISQDEIRLEDTKQFIEVTQLVKKFPVKVEAVGHFPGIVGPLTWRRLWMHDQSATSTKYADVGAIKEYATEIYQSVNENGKFDFPIPVIAFFGISRAVGSGRVTTKSRKNVLGRLQFQEAYQDWDEMKYSKFHYAEWLANYQILLSQKKEFSQTNEAFFIAVQTASSYLTEIRFSKDELWVKAKLDDVETDLMPLSMHSDGIRYFTEMVAELAYRCIVVNGKDGINAVKNATGIVMIDELDLHLHPKWQRHVANDLKRAFPNIQFIVTTHSPFIVQSLKSDEIWNLDKLMDVAPNELKIDTVATEIMGISSPYSETNEELYIKSKKFMEDLESNKSTEELQIELAEISDPAVRAFLELQKISKGK